MCITDHNRSMKDRSLVKLGEVLQFFPSHTPILGWTIGWSIGAATILVTGGLAGWPNGRAVLGLTGASRLVVRWNCHCPSRKTACTIDKRGSNPPDRPRLVCCILSWAHGRISARKVL